MNQLTDEELHKICKTNGWDDSYQSLKFARAAIEAEHKRLMGVGLGLLNLS